MEEVSVGVGRGQVGVRCAGHHSTSPGSQASISETSRWGKSLYCSHVGSGKTKEKAHEWLQKCLQLSIMSSNRCRCRKKDKRPVWGGAGFTEVAGWWLQLSVEAGLRCGQVALLARVFTEERHVFPVRDHRVRHVKRPALHSANHHTAPLGGDETAS